MNRRTCAIAALVALGAAFGCISCAAPGLHSAGTSDRAVSTVQPGALVGTWILEDTFDTPEQPFISFVQDNSWSASDGCNRVQVTWKLSGDGQLATTAGPQTKMSCEGAQLPLTVSTANAVRIEGDSLIIHSSHDATTTIVHRSTDATVGPQGFPIGYWTEEKTSTSPFLNIRADRTYSGSDGCTTLTGTWSPTDDEAIMLTAGATTQMQCDGVNQWLNQAAQGRVRAGVMTIQSSAGDILGQLKGF